MKIMSVTCGKGERTVLCREFDAVDELYLFLVDELEVTHKFALHLVEKRELRLRGNYWIRFECHKDFTRVPFIVPAPFQRRLRSAIKRDAA